MRQLPNRLCKTCGHSLASHLQGVRCALCNCLIESRPSEQESFGFRDSLPMRSRQMSRRQDRADEHLNVELMDRPELGQVRIEEPAPATSSPR